MQLNLTRMVPGNLVTKYSGEEHTSQERRLDIKLSDFYHIKSNSSVEANCEAKTLFYFIIIFIKGKPSINSYKSTTTAYDT